MPNEEEQIKKTEKLLDSMRKANEETKTEQKWLDDAMPAWELLRKLLEALKLAGTPDKITDELDRSWQSLGGKIIRETDKKKGKDKACKMVSDLPGYPHRRTRVDAFNVIREEIQNERNDALEHLKNAGELLQGAGSTPDKFPRG